MKRILILSCVMFMNTHCGILDLAKYYGIHSIGNPSLEFCLRSLGLQNTVHLSTSSAQKPLQVKATTAPVVQQTNPTLTAAVYTLISAAHVYASYMLPQWIDTYMLQLKTKRTNLQNITSFAWRNVDLTLEPQLEVDVNVGNAGFNLNTLHRNFVAELVATSLLPRLTRS